MKLSDVPFSQIYIGQVVKFDRSDQYAWICGLIAEFIPTRDQDRLLKPRYDEISFQHENGKISSAIFHMMCDRVQTIDRVLNAEERLTWMSEVIPQLRAVQT